MSTSLFRLLGRSASQHRPIIACSNVIPFLVSPAHVRHMLSLSSNFGTRASPNLAPRASQAHSNQFSILRFTKSTPWKATHLDRRIPRATRGGQKPPSQSWIDNLPSPIIFWSIFAANAGVFIAWYYAENNYVRGYISSREVDLHLYHAHREYFEIIGLWYGCNRISWSAWKT